MKGTGPGKITAEAIRNLFKKPATMEYAGKGIPELEKRYRGRLQYEPETCVNCKLCMKDCPTGAITIINDGTKEERRMRAVLDVGLCIFCCQCVDSCSKKSLSYSKDIDFASGDKDSLKVEL